MKSLTFWFTLILPFLPLITSAQTGATDIVVGEKLTFNSQILKEERVLQVYLPDSYKEGNQSYPVLYLLDGSRYFLFSVNLQKTFVSFRQTPEFIVVGISKTATERNAYFSYKSDEFLRYVEEEVVNFVDKTYRTTEKRLLFGWAYGGSFVFETLVQNPNLFEAYVAASPFPMMPKLKPTDSLIADNPGLNKQLYFTVGTNEGVVVEGTEKMNTLLTAKAPKSLDWAYREMDGEEHRSTPYPTLYHGVRKYFAYYPELQFSNLQDFYDAGGMSNVREYYQERAKQFGLPKELSDWTMYTLVRNAIRAGDFKQFETFLSEFMPSGFIDRIRVSRACEIAEYYLENSKPEFAISIISAIATNNPESPRPIKVLADAYRAMNQREKAKEYLKKYESLNK